MNRNDNSSEKKKLFLSQWINVIKKIYRIFIPKRIRFIRLFKHWKTFYSGVAKRFLSGLNNISLVVIELHHGLHHHQGISYMDIYKMCIFRSFVRSILKLSKKKPPTLIVLCENNYCVHCLEKFRPRRSHNFIAFGDLFLYSFLYSVPLPSC